MTLSRDEREALVRAHAFVRTHGVRGLNNEAGSALADDLRRMLADISDETIGRVLLRVSEYLGVLAEENRSEALAVTSDQLLLASLDLTATEWRDTRP
jgi:hypothetical protein